VPAALATMAAGWLVVGAVLQGHGGHVHATSYENGGLSLSVDQMLWMSNDMSGQGPLANNNQVFQMDPRMMPGMQTVNNNRLRVQLTLRNLSASARTYAPADFHAIAPDGGRWNAVDDGGALNQKGGTVQPGYAVSLAVYFDIPVAEKNVSIEWSKDGQTIEIPFTGGPAGPHNH
jgi:hypothetical protein